MKGNGMSLFLILITGAVFYWILAGDLDFIALLKVIVREFSELYKSIIGSLYRGL